MIRTLLLTIMLALSVTAQQPTPQPPAQTIEAKQYKKDGSAVIYCGATTKAGKACRRHVKTQGARCYQHKGK